ncbi:predicted protein [Sclerotinia sclerotiorum 1980 UF-70]|uniref:Uncharacterized protein n=1 Tax=Sclerotinia sclerotiorum (strain ATCC 18683 / 1980 / Ss-1) TaxID=665079 RepID=A7EIW2_SCLS1|nr:predicted protein [Sclerotinia sclerotiorum 1980 UF-70]EDO02778.1 predicted protein [Sclerotinia sclerotiorum 1980 UF-70]
MKVPPSEDFDLVPFEGSENEEFKPLNEDFPIASETSSDEDEYAELSSSAPELEPPVKSPDNSIFETFKLMKEIDRLNFICGVLEKKLETLTAAPEKANATNDNTNDGDGTDSDFKDEISDFSSLAIESLREEYHSKLETAFRNDKTSGNIPWIDTVPSLKSLNERLAEWIDRVFDQGITNCLPYGSTSASRFEWEKKYNKNGLNDILRLILRDHESLEDLDKLRRHYDGIIGREMVLPSLKRRIESEKRESVDSVAENSDVAKEVE